MKMYLTDKYFNRKFLRLGHSYEVVPLKTPKLYGSSCYTYSIEIDSSNVVFLTDKDVAESFYNPKEEN